MNGAQALIRTLVSCGVDVCFTNPGTSEMHFVAALDDVPEMRGILGLFEGVVTGAADGYARVAGKPAATLLHLGPGLANGWANLHNARRAHTPIVNIVGDHALPHKQLDAPLESDIEAVARAVSGWVRTSTGSESVAADAADAVTASREGRGQVATLILPADVSWSEARGPAEPTAPAAAGAPLPHRIEAVAAALRDGQPAGFLVGGRVVSDEAGLVAAARAAAGSGAKLLCETFPARLARGAGLPPIDRLGYLAEFAEMQLAGLRHLVVVDTKEPVSFFAYPGKASVLVPDGCQVHHIDEGGVDPVAALVALADALGAPAEVERQAAVRPDAPTGELTAQTMSEALGHLLPEGAIVSDEGNTAGLFVAGATAGCPRHDWLTLTGGSIGQGMPVATGAAVAAGDRKVINLQADGSALYTIQALWTQAREGLDVTTILLNNQSYAILNMELQRVGATDPGPAALSMLDLTNPTTDFCAVAQGLGVPAERATDAEGFTAALERALAIPGPALVEAMLPPTL
ncbi:acetolactate synthase large subunit [Iamia sp. SCSIO 61187]|uniref:acetolactate synthase large subunit n=1 Tax=Iamia sp. SCSIO 61187 TaxID=2722752 RepID=UPI0021076B98|nr:acetolactate synthase large subunit [Iamia sp. SCSIO 61187]QYG95284.1 acetolactate synthase large subunit [Iamia sp. SCSIO 61187]